MHSRIFKIVFIQTFCRFCLIEKKDAQKQVSENEAILRNRINYREALEYGAPSEFGITTNSIFNEIPSFHVTENYAVDLMHDIYEGISHKILCKSLSHFIKKMKYFTIDNLNTRLKYFQYFKSDKGTEKLTITNKEIEDCKLRLSARQMMSLIYYFPILFGEYISNDDEVWNFLLIFFELVDDLLCYEISDSLILSVKIKIELLNRTYQNLFKTNLIPKFHNLVHYPMIMQKSGPLRNLWNFKYEAKHKEFKIYSHIITSRRNITKSFSIKHQINFANLMFTKE